MMTGSKIQDEKHAKKREKVINKTEILKENMTKEDMMTIESENKVKENRARNRKSELRRGGKGKE